MKEVFFTVKEFAEIVGVSTQRIYQLLDKDLQKFCKEFGKSKKISSDALQIFGKSVCKHQNENNTINKALLEQIAIKDRQIELKDNQIFELQNILKSMQEQQLLLTKSLANSQALHAGTIKEHIDSNLKKKKHSFFSILLSKIMKKSQINIE